MNVVTAEFYELPNGEKPVETFLDSLPIPMRAKMAKTISMLEQNGSLLREPYSKPLDDGIFELRAQVGNNISGVLYFFIVDGKAILTNGFIKKQNKTPQSEIKRAKAYRNEYMSRRENNNG